MDVSTENFYWASRIIDTLADHDYASCIQLINRYRNAMFVGGRKLIRKYDARFREQQDPDLLKKANEELCAMARRETTSVLNKLVLESSRHMKNGYNLADN